MEEPQDRSQGKTVDVLELKDLFEIIKIHQDCGWALKYSMVSGSLSTPKF